MITRQEYSATHMNSPISTRRCYPTSTIYPTQYPQQFPTLQYPTEIRVTLHSTSRANPKTEKKPPIRFSFYSDRGGLVFPREIAGKEEEHR